MSEITKNNKELENLMAALSHNQEILDTVKKNGNQDAIASMEKIVSDLTLQIQNLQNN
jgi:hypothetical protein